MTEPATRRWLIGTATALAASAALADGSGVDTVYHPYVQPLEHDLEIRLTHAHADGPLDGQTWRVGYGQTLFDRLFAEAYLIGQGGNGESLDVTGYEVETLWQLTEQGQYAADWAVLGSFEHAHHGDSRDGTLMLIGERQWGRLVGTLNAAVSYEWGAGVHDEPETRLTLQARYRYSPRLEPAIELFAAENLRALGPALLGTERLAPGRRLHWEAGLAVGLDHASPDLSLRGKLEYEF
ncbi:hypothetical protein [Immundisolibacter sp.]|uniref:hypothetical protein n=1 Tax=Immundisolibacter sp. TaxID=1934948 RepID=UPI0026209878|nr:hypothetical protein [Immundisolibacter sp.]MDD3650879.1 hypothetical protein [Immundisolibacter sp.]